MKQLIPYFYNTCTSYAKLIIGVYLSYITLLMNIITGDEVSFIVKHTPKGVQADGLQLMIPEVSTKSI